MAFSYVFTLFMFLGGLFGGGNDLLDYIPAEAYWKLKATQLTYENMADEVGSANPEAAVNLAKVFETATGEDRDRLALALINQGESARRELDRLSRSADPELAARANACLAAIDNAPKERSVRRLMAIRTLGGLGKKEAIPLLRPLLKSVEPFVAAYAAEAIASLEGRRVPVRPVPPAVKDDIWRFPADCRAVGQVVPKVAGPDLPDLVLGAMNLPPGIDRADAIDGLTFTLVQIADRFGDMRFEGITLGGSGDLAENAGYVLAIVRGHYDHATVNRILSGAQTPFNEFPGGRIYVPGGMAIYAPSDDLLVFAASPKGESPVQAVITAVASAPATRPAATQPITQPATAPTGADPAAAGPARQLQASAEMVGLVSSVDTSQPVWLAVKTCEAWRNIPGLAALETFALTGSPAHGTPLELHLESKLADATSARDAAAAITALLPAKPAAVGAQGERAASSSPLMTTLAAAMAGKGVNVDGDRVHATVTLTLVRADVMRILLTSMDRPQKEQK